LAKSRRIQAGEASRFAGRQGLHRCLRLCAGRIDRIVCDREVWRVGLRRLVDDRAALGEGHRARCRRRASRAHFGRRRVDPRQLSPPAAGWNEATSVSSNPPFDSSRVSLRTVSVPARRSNERLGPLQQIISVAPNEWAPVHCGISGALGSSSLRRECLAYVSWCSGSKARGLCASILR
jgi:hypothetical protein